MAAASRETHSALEGVIGHRFADPSLLARALTHRSVIGLRKSGEAMEHAQDKFANERLEFLGDRVLGLVIAELLIDTFPDEAEGQLAQRLALLVSAPTLARVARASGMAGAIRMAPGQAADDIDAVLADACEAVIGAVYVDGGMAPAKAFILSQWTTLVSESQAPPKDAKSTLQEWAQGRGLALPAYAVHERSGPDHAPNFYVTVSLSTGERAQGAGRSKRIAEQAAAAALLAKLGESAPS